MATRNLLGAWIIIGLLLFSATNTYAQKKQFEGVTLTVSSYGGPWDDTQRLSIAERLKEQFGATVIYQPGVAIQAIAKATTMKANPEFDLMYIDSPNMPRAIEAGIIDEVTDNDVPNLSRVYPGAREFGKYGVPIVFVPFGLAYNTQKVKTPPTGYSDLGNPEYKGKVALFDLTNDAGIIALLALNSGGIGNVDQGFAKLRALAPNLLTITPSSGTMAQLIQQEEAWVAPHYAARILLLKKQGSPVNLVIPKDGAYTTVSYVNLVKGSKNRAAALKYLDLALADEAQLAMAERNFYPPTSSEVKIPDNVAAQLPFHGVDSVKKLKSVDWEAVSKNRTAWIERWNMEMRR
jgi:putative spermidine/putrescine transport system substrate-binding protein